MELGNSQSYASTCKYIDLKWISSLISNTKKIENIYAGQFLEDIYMLQTFPSSNKLSHMWLTTVRRYLKFQPIRNHDWSYQQYCRG